MNKYSIIIPVYNEINSINALLKSLKCYFKKGHEIILIDDGSTDGSKNILTKNKIIKLISIKNNKGKGYAIKEGLKIARNNKIIIFDGDMELDPAEISKLMILNKKDKIFCTMGYRFESLNPFKSSFDWGNFIFTTFFNIIFSATHKDILCCAKSFYLDQIKIDSLKSIRFAIDLELSSLLTFSTRRYKIPQVLLHYKRRSSKDGKKLEISDGWKILKRILIIRKNIN